MDFTGQPVGYIYSLDSFRPIQMKLSAASHLTPNGEAQNKTKQTNLTMIAFLEAVTSENV